MFSFHFAHALSKQKDNSAFEFAGFPYESDTSGIESTAFSKVSKYQIVFEGSDSMVSDHH